MNQINVMLMLLGCAVVVYAFSVTFWESQPVEIPGIERLSGPAAGPPSGRTSSEIPVLRRLATTETSAVEGLGPGRDQVQPPAGRRSVVPLTSRTVVPRRGRGDVSARTSSVTGQPTTQPSRTTSIPVERPGGEVASQPPPLDEEAGDPTADSLSGVPDSFEPGPPPVAESQKRETSNYPDSPPVRSSLLGRNPRRN